MPKKMIATETFRAVVNGFSDLVTAGQTIVDDDDQLVRDYREKFEPLERERPEVEEATAEPGVKRGQQK